jgi:hypothetical protein
MHTQLNQTANRAQPRPPIYLSAAAAPGRLTAPRSSGLTRAQLRQIVIEQLG